MEAGIGFVNSNNQYGLDVLDEEAEDVNISREGESGIGGIGGIGGIVDIENGMEVIEAEEACNK